jgi:hypothetical protein
MHVDHRFLRLDGRVFEVLSDESDYQHRLHVDVVGFEVSGPDRKGRHKARIGRMENGELSPGSQRTRFELDEAEYRRFSALVEAAHAARDAGPEPWEAAPWGRAPWGLTPRATRTEGSDP